MCPTQTPSRRSSVSCSIIYTFQNCSNGRTFLFLATRHAATEDKGYVTKVNCNASKQKPEHGHLMLHGVFGVDALRNRGRIGVSLGNSYQNMNRLRMHLYAIVIWILVLDSAVVLTPPISARCCIVCNEDINFDVFGIWVCVSEVHATLWEWLRRRIEVNCVLKITGSVSGSGDQ